MPENKTFTRKINIDFPKTLDVENRSVSVIAATETPANIFDPETGRFWDEVLLSKGCVVSEIGRVPLLENHQRRGTDDVLGSFREIQIQNDQVVGRVFYDQSAETVWNKTKAGHLTDFSVGYIPTKVEYLQEGETITIDGKSFEGPLKVTKEWRLLELSVTPIGLDPGAKVRNNDILNKIDSKINELVNEQRRASMPEKVDKKEVKTPEVSIEQVRNEVREQEMKRQADIQKISERYGERYPQVRDMAKKAIQSGENIEVFNRSVLETMGDIEPVEPKSFEIGMSEKEVNRYSFCRAMLAASTGDWKNASFERSVHEATAKKTNKTPQGFLIPVDVLSKPIMKRDLTVGTATAGGNLVATNLLTSSFIDMLRDRMILPKIGSTILTGLEGNLAIPKQTGGATAYWVTEGSDLTESQQAFGQVALTPKTMGAYTEISRKLLIQSSLDVEAFVRGDLAKTIAQELQRVAFVGDSASDEPKGIENQTGINTVDIDTNGGAITFATVVDMETESAIDNADFGSLAYVTNASVRGEAKQTQIFSGTDGSALWKNGADGVGEMNGYSAYVTNAIPATYTKGTSSDLSALFFGNFSDLILGMWSGIDILVNPYAKDLSGGLRIVVFQDCDIAVRNPVSFCVCDDIVTPLSTVA